MKTHRKMNNSSDNGNRNDSNDISPKTLSLQDRRWQRCAQSPESGAAALQGLRKAMLGLHSGFIGVILILYLVVVKKGPRRISKAI